MSASEVFEGLLHCLKSCTVFYLADQKNSRVYRGSDHGQAMPHEPRMAGVLEQEHRVISTLVSFTQQEARQ